MFYTIMNNGGFSSTGGHVNSGEIPLETIKREAEEELGINVDEDEIQKLIEDGKMLKSHGILFNEVVKQRKYTLLYN